MKARCCACHKEIGTPIQVIHHTIEVHPKAELCLLSPSLDPYTGRVKYSTKHFGGICGENIDTAKGISFDNSCNLNYTKLNAKNNVNNHAKELSSLNLQKYCPASIVVVQKLKKNTI